MQWPNQSFVCTISLLLVTLAKTPRNRLYKGFIDTRDISEAIIDLTISEINNCEVFNFSTGNEYSVFEIIDFISIAMNKNLIIKTCPKKIRKVEKMHLVSDSSKLLRMTKWIPQYSVGAAIKEIFK